MPWTAFAGQAQHLGPARRPRPAQLSYGYHPRLARSRTAQRHLGRVSLAGVAGVASISYLRQMWKDAASGHRYIPLLCAGTSRKASLGHTIFFSSGKSHSQGCVLLCISLSC